ncbi:5-hydroxytryptamine receptor 3A-like [Leptodactylus fuscus]|uniref:5-hydroxytryptamine receptor 3A-like n=1 Tax=Leptodactylus fuscus TaxID=238119 RepID=UPI003F4EEAC5
MCGIVELMLVMESIFITRIVHEQNFHRAVPKWLQTLAFEKMSTWLCLKDKDHFITSSKDGSYTSEQKDSSSTEMLTNYNDENIKNYDRQLSATQDSEVLFRILKEVVSIREELKKNAQDTNNSKTRKPTLLRLHDHLTEGYNKGMRPVHNWRDEVVVYIDMVIYAILGVDEKNQLLRSYTWLKTSWTDEFLTWDPKDFDNVTQISIPYQDIWTPDIIVLEFVEATRSPEAPYVHLQYTGRVINTKPLIITTTCSLNIYYFPFDTQRCSISFSSWLHTAQEINITVMEHTDRINDFHTSYMNDGEWDLINLISTFTIIQDRVKNLGEIEFTIVIQRKPLFYVMTLILPSMFLMIMDVAGFYLPPESGERISFKITLLLGYSVFLLIISDTLPAVGTPLIGVYFAMCLALLVIGMMESIFIVRMVRQQNFHLQIPRWVKTLVLEKIPVLFFMKDVVQAYTSKCSQQIENVDLPNCNNNDSEGIKGTSVEASATKDNVKLMSSMLKEITLIRQHIKNTCEGEITNEWLLVAQVLDMCLFRAYISIVIIFTIILAVIWARMHNGFTNLSQYCNLLHEKLDFLTKFEIRMDISGMQISSLEQPGCYCKPVWSKVKILIAPKSIITCPQHSDVYHWCPAL